MRARLLLATAITAAAAGLGPAGHAAAQDGDRRAASEGRAAQDPAASGGAVVLEPEPATAGGAAAPAPSAPAPDPAPTPSASPATTRAAPRAATPAPTPAPASSTRTAAPSRPTAPAAPTRPTTAARRTTGGRPPSRTTTTSRARRDRADRPQRAAPPPADRAPSRAPSGTARPTPLPVRAAASGGDRDLRPLAGAVLLALAAAGALVLVRGAPELRP